MSSFQNYWSLFPHFLLTSMETSAVAQPAQALSLTFRLLLTPFASECIRLCASVHRARSRCSSRQSARPELLYIHYCLKAFIHQGQVSHVAATLLFRCFSPLLEWDKRLIISQRRCESGWSGVVLKGTGPCRCSNCFNVTGQILFGTLSPLPSGTGPSCSLPSLTSQLPRLPQSPKWPISGASISLDRFHLMHLCASKSKLLWFICEQKKTHRFLQINKQFKSTSISWKG